MRKDPRPTSQSAGASRRGAGRRSRQLPSAGTCTDARTFPPPTTLGSTARHRADRGILPRRRAIRAQRNRQGRLHGPSPPRYRRRAAGAATHQEMLVPGLDFDRFDALTFDCYGTLIDWETGILAAPPGGAGPAERAPGDDELLERYAAARGGARGRPVPALPGGAWAVAPRHLRRSRRRAHGRRGRPVRRLGRRLAGVPRLAGGARPAEAPLPARGDHQLRRRPVRAPRTAGSGSTFDWVVTAQQAGSYKPSERNFELAFERIDVPRERILHVAQSLYHDHVPARLGLATAWIDRRHDRPGVRGDAARRGDAGPDRARPGDVRRPRRRVGGRSARAGRAERT